MNRRPAGRAGPIGIRCALALLALGTAGCASGPPVVEGPGGLPALPSSERATSEPAPAGTKLDVARAARTADGALVHSLAVRTLERCGTRPLGQQALLVLAAAELDPRNSEGRASVALEALRLVGKASEPDAWTRVLSESLYLLAQRVGGGARTAGTAAEEALRASARRGNERRLAADAAACRAVAWPDGRTEEPGDLPSLEGASYPARIAWLQRKVSELEGELQRLRRITTGQP